MASPSQALRPHAAAQRIFFVNVSTTPFLPLIGCMGSLRKLCISIKRLFGNVYPATQFSHSLFANITHLDVFDHAVGAIPDGLSLIPSLTHVTSNHAELLDAAPQILETCVRGFSS
jgi:hypothetical protein